MKRILFFIIAIITFASCSKDNEEQKIPLDYDIMPIDFLFDITNADGESLIDKDSPAYDSVFIANTYIKFQGKEYKMGEDADVYVKPSTRFYPEAFHGIMIYKMVSLDETKTLARIGGFISGYDWKSEEIDIHWGDNSEDKIVFTFMITSISVYEQPTISKKILFNGKDCTETFSGYYNYMRIVKKSVKEN